MKELPLQESTNTSRESGDDEELKAKVTSLKSKFKRLKSKYDELLDEKKKSADTRALEVESAAGTCRAVEADLINSLNRLQEENQAVGTENRAPST